MASIFTRIIRGEIPSHRVYEDERHYAFLDINPVQRGHTLVVPKREVDYVFDLEPEELGELWKAAQVVAKALQEATGCRRVVTTVVGVCPVKPAEFVVFQIRQYQPGSDVEAQGG